MNQLAIRQELNVEIGQTYGVHFNNSDQHTFTMTVIEATDKTVLVESPERECKARMTWNTLKGYIARRHYRARVSE